MKKIVAWIIIATFVFTLLGSLYILEGIWLVVVFVGIFAIAGVIAWAVKALVE